MQKENEENQFLASSQLPYIIPKIDLPENMPAVKVSYT